MVTPHNTMATDTMTTNESHRLAQSWVLYAHLPHDTDWSLKSYKQIYQLDTVEGTIAVSETLEEEISDPIWKQAREGLKNQLGEGTFKSWISKLNFQIILDNTAHLTAPTKFIKEWILTNYSEDIKRNLNIHGANIKEILIQAT